MRELTPESIAADIKAARAYAAETIKRVTAPACGKRSPSSFSAAVIYSHAKPARVVQGHAGQGGLQTHSLGGLYPWMVVGYGDGTFAAENAVTGEKMSRRFDYETAAEWAERLKAGRD